jgi:hypothetical protein
MADLVSSETSLSYEADTGKTKPVINSNSNNYYEKWRKYGV